MSNEATTFLAKKQKYETISKEILATTHTVLKSVEATYSKKGSDYPEVGTSAADSMEDITILFEVHKCFKEMKINASLTLDDWASLVIKGKEYGAKEGIEVTPVNIDMLKTAELAGERGGHMLWTKEVKDVILKSGKYTIKITHQNVTYAADYDPKYNDATCNFSIQATAVNHFKKLDAQSLLDKYNAVNYKNMKNATDVWKYCGGSLHKYHIDTPKVYTNSCALRLSIALGNYGLSLPAKKPSAPYNATDWYALSTTNCNNVFGSTSYVIIRARELGNYIENSLGMGDLHFTSKAAYEEFGAKQGDIVLFYDSDHVGMGTGYDFTIGNYRNEKVWVL